MMSESEQAKTEWLPLSKAAARLSVHPTTLRRWADQGEIPVMLTPGGHRRFAVADLVQFARERRTLKNAQDLGQIWADKAIAETRRELIVHQDDAWLANYDDDARQRHRSLGQKLMGLTLRYLSAENGEQTPESVALLQQAREIGYEYASIALKTSTPLSDALRASMFFRDTLVETALHLPENVHVRSDVNVRLLRRINSLLNTVHLAIAEVYDDNYADSVSRS